MTYKNKNYKTRSYDCSNVVFCETEKNMDENWIECSKSEIYKLNCTQLYIQDNIKYYGYL